jgi:hypothetical protein
MPKPPANQKNIDLIVVVSGTPQPVRVNIHQKLEHLVEEALRESGNVGQPASEWELRSENGQQLDITMRIMDAGVIAGETLFLNPRAGAGG